jgi:hypothetical protein
MLANAHTGHVYLSHAADHCDEGTDRPLHWRNAGRCRASSNHDGACPDGSNHDHANDDFDARRPVGQFGFNIFQRQSA